MTTVAILPVESETGSPAFEAVAGGCIASGETAGEALDAISAQFPEVGEQSLVLVQRFKPDEFFSAKQQRRLQELMQRWRTSRDGGSPFASSEMTELQALIEAELVASGRRAEAAAGKVGL
jgi:hypothetical protein